MNIKLLLSTLFALVLTTSLWAQGRSGGGQRTQMMNQMKAELNLDETQEAAWNAINENYMGQFQAIRQDNTLGQEDKRAQMMGLRDSWQSELYGILNEDQQAKWDELQAEGQARRQENAQGRREQGRERAEELSEKVKEDLQLTEEQSMQWTELNKSYGEKQKAILEDDALSREEKRDQMSAIQAEKNEELAQILSPEQMEQWEAIREDAREKGKGKRRRNNGGRQ